MIVKTTRLLAAVSMAMIAGCISPDQPPKITTDSTRVFDISSADISVFKDDVAGNTCYVYHYRGISCVPTHKEALNVQ
mgnify:FL=1